jgi:hypothetical protein
LAPGEKTDGRAVASLGPAGASAPFAASPPLREAVMVASRNGGMGIAQVRHICKDRRAARRAAPLMGASGSSHRIEAEADCDLTNAGFLAIFGRAEIGTGSENAGRGW